MANTAKRKQAPKKKPVKRKKPTQSYRRIVIALFLGMSVGALLMLQYREFRYYNPPAEYISIGNEKATPESPYSLPKAEPVSLYIPKLGINTTFEAPLGLNADQSVEVPHSFDKVGWYKYGPTPGELGPAVVLGHVDSYMGPAVFYSLGQLSVGDPIFVFRNDGSVAKFLVTALKRYQQDNFPTELVYGDIDYAGLRLITCSGIYDHGTRRYDHNLVVYAVLDDPNASSTATSTATS